ncbi:facilitated trehalose transporter Tret1-2 homolog [Macrosteles quadrilineatus]|uniref:facilitated trehalose transporter Tret1-2 homolog n=1 Tax=Macrosteles quadrilineatus TaxID=74068 RepID=UPI0023E3503F|nr:facilitated trehalose transporter Tret1-2 homolog [Macrosteles quadrilineatus]
MEKEAIHGLKSLLQRFSATGRTMIDNFGQKWSNFKDLGIGKALAATVATHINSVSVGMCQGYSAILLPQLQDPSSPLHVDTEEASWIASLGVISNPLGAILSGLLMEWLGRKRAVQLVSIPFLLGWLIIACCNNLFFLCIGRAITGVAIGMGAACYVYVAEISLPEHRGFLSAFGPIFVSLGVLLVYSFGYMFSWQVASAVCAVFAGISAFVMSLIPESPSWLLAHSKEKKARQAIVWFRGDNDQAAQELADLSESLREKNAENEGRGNQWGQFLSPSVWKPFLILITFFAFQEGSGLYIMLYYAVNFFQESGSTMNKYVLCIIVASVRLVMSVVGTVAIKKFNRRTMACVSGAGMALSMGVAGSYEFLYGRFEVASRPLPWLPQACIVANVCASMLGMLQLPWVMIGELFPTAVRGIMSGVVSSLAYFFIFVIVKVYPQCLRVLGVHGMMFTFAGISLLAIFYVVLFLPETQGKTLLEIEARFRGEKKSQKEAEASKS